MNNKKMNKIKNEKLKNAIKKIDNDNNKNIEKIDTKELPIANLLKTKTKQKRIDDYFISIKKK
tara:strand:+ start:2997 stop:3185 length:189 start_codon:yes stop_codon:yes gene_type:complete